VTTNTKAIHTPGYRSLVALISGTRRRQGLSQAELGRRMRLSRQTVQKIETCEVRLDLVRYIALCRILGLNAGQLLGRLEEPSEEDGPPFYVPEWVGWRLSRGFTPADYADSKSLCASLCATSMKGP
jgi:transcriptional regulator with XRE-family HTH domain